MYGGIWTPPSSDKACFLCVVHVQGASKHMRVSKHTGRHMGHPNIWGHPNIQRGIQMYGGIWTPPYSDKACFLCVVYVQGASKHMGHPYVWKPLEYAWTLPYVWMPPVHTQHKESMLCHTKGVHMPHTFGYPICLDTPCWASKHHPNMGVSKHTGVIQTYGDIQTYRGAFKHMGYPNIWGHPNVWGHMETPLI